MHCTHPASIHTQMHSLCNMEYILTCIQTHMHTYSHLYTHAYICMHIYFTNFFCLTRSSFGCAFRWLPLPLCLTLCSLSLSVCPSVWLSLRIVPSRFALLLSRFALSLSLSLAQRNVPNWFIIQAKNIHTHKAHTHTYAYRDSSILSFVHTERPLLPIRSHSLAPWTTSILTLNLKFIHTNTACHRVAASTSTHWTHWWQ